jgi:hypothetical protein
MYRETRIVSQDDPGLVSRGCPIGGTSWVDVQSRAPTWHPSCSVVLDWGYLASSWPGPHASWLPPPWLLRPSVVRFGVERYNLLPPRGPRPTMLGFLHCQHRRPPPCGSMRSPAGSGSQSCQHRRPLAVRCVVRLRLSCSSSSPQRAFVHNGSLVSSSFVHGEGRTSLPPGGSSGTMLVGSIPFLPAGKSRVQRCGDVRTRPDPAGSCGDPWLRSPWVQDVLAPALLKLVNRTG